MTLLEKMIPFSTLIRLNRKISIHTSSWERNGVFANLHGRIYADFFILKNKINEKYDFFSFDNDLAIIIAKGRG